MTRRTADLVAQAKAILADMRRVLAGSGANPPRIPKRHRSPSMVRELRARQRAFLAKITGGAPRGSR